MTDRRPSIWHRRGARRWTFASCTFDEASWSLTVNGQRTAMETKPLELLRELLSNAGHVVSKDELLDAIWPDVMVVEASLPTAVHKLRAALGDSGRDPAIIETVSGIGYRLVGPVEVEEAGEPSRPSATKREDKPISLRRPWFTGGLAAASLAALLTLTIWTHSSAIEIERPRYSQEEAKNALRQLDIPAVQRMLAAGWNPNTPFDSEGNGALNYVLEICEWDRAHDQRRLMLMVRTLYENGALVDRRNVWGDTAYSIASAPRYCGPNHPATKALYVACYDNRVRQVVDRCLASYQLARRTRRVGSKTRV